MSQPVLRNDEPFPVSVEFLSDWSCGTGTVHYGVVDREVQRDHEGYPLLRGKAMAAMLRDAAETVAAGLDEDGSDCWQWWIKVIFGSQRPLEHTGYHPADRAVPVAAALRPRPLRIPEKMRAAIAAYDPDTARLAREALVLVRPGVAIDDETGAAEDQMLRMEERASAGLTLTAQWRLRFDDLPAGAPVPWEAELLLLAAAWMVDHVGGRRRRGAGRCQVTIGTPPADSDRLSTLLDQVAQARPPDKALTARRPVSPAALPASRLGGRRRQPLRHRYDLRLTALTPLLIARAVTGNTVLTERYVPGASLLPWIAHALGPDATALITGGQVVVTHATIEIDGRRALPMPRALHAPKDHPNADTLVNVMRAPADPRWRGKPAGGFSVPVSDGLLRGEPRLVAHTHAVVDDATQRPNERTGGLYTYQAIEAGTVLRAEVWLPDGVPLDRSTLTGECTVGRSHKDDYGQVRIEVHDPTPQRVTGPAGAGELVVWLLSDLLLRGSAGEPAADLACLASTLGEALGVRLTVPHTLSAGPAAVLGASRTESWQTRWGLPRPSLTGLAGGSVVRFEMAGVPDPAAYEQVVAAGLGERTAEGFGRIALQPPLLTAAEVPVRSPAPAAPASLAAPQSPADPHSEAAARTYAVRGWRRELHRQAVARACDDALRKRLIPAGASAAQLGTLRTIAEQLHTTLDPAPVRTWLKQTSAIRHRREAWLEKNPDRLQTLECLFQGPNDELWELLAIRPPAALTEQLYWPALAWLLAEAARTQSNGQPGEET